MSWALRIAMRSSPTTKPVSITGWTRACLFSPRRYPADVWPFAARPRRRPSRASSQTMQVYEDSSIPWSNVSCHNVANMKPKNPGPSYPAPPVLRAAPLTRRDFTAARLAGVCAGHGNFSGLLPNVAGIDLGYFNEERIRWLVERVTLDSAMRLE
jgi:hypothetical protein